MEIRDRIREMSVLPPRFNIMLDQALLSVGDTQQREDLCAVACVVSSATWQHWQSWRAPEDNRQEHEWVVFANVMRIAESEKLPLTDRRIATAFCFLHDTCFIKRIMEEEIRELERKNLMKEAAELTQMKKNQRVDHMKGGAENARFLLSQLKHPDSQSTPLLEPDEVERCVDIVSKHDLWKVDPPKPPPTSDRLALACLEGDVLWPLHPIGVLADLDRPGKEGMSEDPFNPSKWRKQLKQSLQTIVEFRSRWKDIPNDDFIDGESIFRTEEGHRLYSEWRKFWNL
ncbi:MAG: hypothetical protein MHPDNHAH_01009 [Anaerolineales bacterium]|nr:hypothetical protein [Anaerolineales bacterium]